MNQIKLIFRGFKSLLLLILLIGLTPNVYAKDKGCWVDFFESAQYKGEHFRVKGNTNLKTLNDVNGANWDSRIVSLIVGPKAKVTVFEHRNFKLPLTEMAKYPVLMKSLGITEQDIREEAELIFTAKARIHALSDFNFYHKTRSLKVECVK
ncbi:MAG: hypothetical protein GQ569_04255 [Methylococcaceae bacterium]|nr:hypothetical protein [Methylococcaceae bacterium]